MLTQNEDGTDIEDLVDDFATFYAAGDLFNDVLTNR